MATINWGELSKHRIVLLASIDHSDCVVWNNVPSEEWALPLLLDHPDIVKWAIVSRYEWAMPLLQKYPGCVVWNVLPDTTWSSGLSRHRQPAPRVSNPTLPRYPATYAHESYDIANIPNQALIPRTVLGLVQQARVTGRYEFAPAQWARFSGHRDALHVLQKYPEKVHWAITSTKVWAIPLLMQHAHRVDWSALAGTPALLQAIRTDFNNMPFQFLVKEKLGDAFSLEYSMMKQSRIWLLAEIAEFVYHPRFIQKWLDEGNQVEDYLN
jgi:hypothetical protein